MEKYWELCDRRLPARVKKKVYSSVVRPRVKEFKYLESTVQESDSCEREVKRRGQDGWTNGEKYRGLCDRRLPARVKGKVYSSAVRPAMVYGFETVAVTKNK